MSINSITSSEVMNSINYLGQKVTTKNEEWQKKYGRLGSNTRAKQLLEENTMCFKGGKSRGKQLKTSTKTCEHCKQTIKEVTYFIHNHHKGECVLLYDKYVSLANEYFESGLSRAKLGKKLGIPPHHIQMAVDWYRKNSEWYLAK